MRILFFIIFIFSSNVFAGPIAGVPNDLRRQFKGVHHFKEIEIEVNGQKILARLDPTTNRPILFYNIPQTMQNPVMDDVVTKQFPSGLTWYFSKKLEDDGMEYQFYLRGKKIDGAWMEVFPVKGEKLAIGIKAPLTNEVTKFKDGNGGHYFLHNHKIVEQRILERGKIDRVIFAEDSNLPERNQQELIAEPDEKGTLEKFKLPQGSFPDQIMVDKNGHLWFTQPRDNLLTHFDPKENKWENIQVGELPDGLWIDRRGRLWFGEYGGEHMGQYNPKTKKYQRFKMPYAPSAPAIPYEDHKGLIWITDHENDKVSVMNVRTKQWETYATPSAGAWIVQLFQMENGNLDIWGTHCYSNAIGQINYETREYKEFPMGVSTCPAFAIGVGDKIYMSLWTGGSLMALNSVTGDIEELIIRDAKQEYWETGTGPIGKDGKGNVYFVSLQRGRAYKYNTKDGKLTYVSGVGPTKDGLIVDRDGTVWITEMGDSLVKVTFSN